MIQKRIERPFTSTVAVATVTSDPIQNFHGKTGNIYVDASGASGTGTTNVSVYTGFNTEHLALSTATGNITEGDAAVKIPLDNLGLIIKLQVVGGTAVSAPVFIALEINEEI